LASDDRAGSGRIGGDRLAAAGQAVAGEPGLPGSVALRLVIVGTEPLSGPVGLAQSAVLMDFSGWIGLMSAINELLAQLRRDQRAAAAVPAQVDGHC
jgi:hypothetical protein